MSNDTVIEQENDLYSESEFKKLISRLNRIEGQVRGVKNMLQNGKDCNDILIQVSSINSALHSFNKELLSKHIKESLKKDLLDGREDGVDELVTAVQRLMK